MIPSYHTSGKTWLLTVTFVVLYAIASFAQQPFEFRQFSKAEGLHNSHINTLAQTENGLLIVGHRNGVSTFDGRNFRDLVLADSSNAGSIQDIFCRKDGSVLMGSETGLIFEFFKGELQQLKDTLPNSVVSILHDEVNEQELIFSRNMQVMIRAGSEVKVFSAPVQEILLTSVAHISGNRFLIGTNSGLFNAQIDLNKGFKMLWEEPIPLIPTSKITALLHEPSRKLTWVATEDQGMYVVKNIHTEKQSTSKINIHYSYQLSSISELHRDRFGNMWLGTFGHGVLRAENVDDDFQSARIHRFNLEDGQLSNNLVTDIYEDSEGNMWVGTFGGGLSQIVEKVFYEPFEPSFLRSHTVNTVHHDSKGNVWLGIEQGVFLSKSFLGKPTFIIRIFLPRRQSGNIHCGGPIWKYLARYA